MRILRVGRSKLQGTGGFVLIQSLITMAAILIGAAAMCGALAQAVRHGAWMKVRIEAEQEYRRAAVRGRL